MDEGNKMLLPRLRSLSVKDDDTAYSCGRTTLVAMLDALSDEARAQIKAKCLKYLDVSNEEWGAWCAGRN
jgi:hypothetical protein